MNDLDSITSNSKVDVAFRVSVVLNKGFERKYFTTQFSLDTRNCSTTGGTVNSRGRQNLAMGVGSIGVGQSRQMSGRVKGDFLAVI